MDINLEAPAQITRAIEQLCEVCKTAWERGSMAGWSGNASFRLSRDPDLLLITAAGTPKGHLSRDNFLLLNSQGEIVCGKGKASSESLLHIALYKKWSGINAILHTHPPFMQSLELWLEREALKTIQDPKDQFLHISIYEASLWRERLFFGEDCPPGTPELALSAVKGIENALQKKGQERVPLLPCGIWLPHHGLCAAGRDPEECLCLTEELEHLAQIQLLQR